MFYAIAIIALVVITSTALTGCSGGGSSDTIQSKQQEKMLKEGTAQTGMPAIVNFQERKLAKQVLEMRDQEGLATYTYMKNHTTGKLVFICESVGYGIPAYVQYTNPQKVEREGSQYAVIMPQADPNGLYSPAAADGTWLLVKDPNSKKVSPVYFEEKNQRIPF